MYVLYSCIRGILEHIRTYFLLAEIKFTQLNNSKSIKSRSLSKLLYIIWIGFKFAVFVPNKLLYFKRNNLTRSFDYLSSLLVPDATIVNLYQNDRS